MEDSVREKEANITHLGWCGWACACLLTSSRLFSNSMIWRAWVRDLIWFRSAATLVFLGPVGDQGDGAAPLRCLILMAQSAAEHRTQAVIKHCNATPIPGYICLIMMVRVAYLSGNSQQTAAKQISAIWHQQLSKNNEGEFTDPVQRTPPPLPHLVYAPPLTTLTSIWSIKLWK